MKFHCHCLRPTLIFFLVTPQNCKDALIPSLCQWNRRVMKLCVCVAEQMVTKTRPDQSKAGLIDWWALTIMLKERVKQRNRANMREIVATGSNTLLQSTISGKSAGYFFSSVFDAEAWRNYIKCTLKSKRLPSTHKSARICRCDTQSCVCMCVWDKHTVMLVRGEEPNVQLMRKVCEQINECRVCVYSLFFLQFIL